MRFEWRDLDPRETDHELIWAWVGIVAIVGFAVWRRSVGLPPVFCPFKSLTTWPCLTCGGTRALGALVDGQLWTSLRLNPAVATAGLLSSLYLPYAVLVAHLRTRRVRVLLAPRDWTLLRWSVAVTAVASWAFLIADGR